MAPDERGADERRAASPTDGAPSAAAISRQDLLNLGADLKTCFEAMLAQKITPVLQQLTELASDLKDVSHTADTAMELGLALQDENKSLQRAEQQLRLKVAALEAQARASNLKFRGFPESQEFDSNLTSALARWLASILHLEEGVLPTILQAYRLGPLAAVRPNFPRDIIAQFLYPRSRNAILKKARSGVSLKFEGHPIQILLDLTPDVLAKRRALKTVTDTLRKNNVRFRWSPLSDVMVYKEGKQLCAEDAASGRRLLQSLNITIPPDLCEEGHSPSSSQDKD